MSAPAKVGEYTVDFYNGYGTKLRDKRDHKGCFIEALEYGREQVKLLKEAGNLDTVHSFTIDRRIHNSLNALDTAL